MSGILIAGGGLAGAATAIALAQAGRKVTLIEREAVPTHKICGEFLSAEAQISLSRLGFNCRTLGGERITHVRLIRGNRSITAKLPFEGLGLTRKTLDESLLRHAAAAGVSVQRGHAVQRISLDGGLHVEVDRSPPLNPETLFLATGKHETRGVARDGKPSRLVGFKTYFRLSPAQHMALAGHVELFLFPGGYAGLQRVENGQANFCLVVEAGLLARAGSKFPALLAHLQNICPQLAARCCYPRRLRLPACHTGLSTARARKTRQICSASATRPRSSRLSRVTVWPSLCIAPLSLQSISFVVRQAKPITAVWPGTSAARSSVPRLCTRHYRCHCLAPYYSPWPEVSLKPWQLAPRSHGCRNTQGCPAQFDIRDRDDTGKTIAVSRIDLNQGHFPRQGIATSKLRAIAAMAGGV